MAHPRGESGSDAVRLDFDRRLMLQFRGSLVISDALAYRELDDVLGLTEMAGDVSADARSGKNGRHALAGLFRQSVFGRLAGYEDVNDAERLRRDPAMRWIVGGKAAQSSAASPSQMGRFETQWLAAPENFAALADLSGQWIDLVHGRRPPRGIVLDMDSSVSPTHGEQENSVWNGHYACTCYHPLFVFNQFGDLERCALRAGHVTALTAGTTCSSPSWRATRAAQSDDLRTMCAGSMPIFSYQAGTWTKPRRVVCHERRREYWRRATVREMKEGPSGSAIRC
jgi:hypothetical protein